MGFGAVQISAGITKLSELAIDTGKDWMAKRITDMAEPLIPSDVATKHYVDHSPAGGLPLAGGTMEGSIDMASHGIIGVPDPIGNDEVANKKYVDSKFQAEVPFLSLLDCQVNGSGDSNRVPGTTYQNTYSVPIAVWVEVFINQDGSNPKVINFGLSDPDTGEQWDEVREVMPAGDEGWHYVLKGIIPPGGNYTFFDYQGDPDLTIYTWRELIPGYIIESFSDTTNQDLNHYGRVGVPTHGSITISTTPHAGYHVTDCQVDGASKGAVDTWTFTDVVENHDIGFTVEAIE